MPVLDGYSAARAIRAGEAGPDAAQLPIIALTAEALPGDRERCLEAGMNDYLSKPLHLESLEDVLRRFLPRADPGEAGPDTRSGSTPARPDPRVVTAPAVHVDDLLLRCRGKAELARQLIRQLQEQAVADLTTLRLAVQQEDSAGIAAVAHGLKGTAGNLCAQPIYLTATALNDQARAGDLADAPALVERLDREVGDLLAFTWPQ